MKFYSTAEFVTLEGIFDIHRQEVVGTVERHAHNFLELFYIERGWASHTLGEKTRHLNVGDYMLVDHTTSHSFDVVSNDLCVINCLFKPRLLDACLTHYNSLQEMLNHYTLNIGYPTATFDDVFHDSRGTTDKKQYDGNSQPILLLLHKMIEEYTEKSTGYIQMIRAILIELVIHTMRTMEQRHIDYLATQDTIILEIIEQLSQNINEASSLSVLSKKYNISISQLSRKFKAATGYGYVNYLQTKRMEVACRLLSNTTHKISDICYECGYQDIKFFNQTFKKRMGTSPKCYRQGLARRSG